MFDFYVLWEWVEFVVCWLYVIIVIVWIGLLFYFIVLDFGLYCDCNFVSGVDGEEWQVYGGGFYYVQKYLIVLDKMFLDLVWFKWESYLMWLLGFVLLVIVYYIGGDLYLIDLVKVDISVLQGVMIFVVLFGFGWVVYDQLCKSCLGENSIGLMLLLFVILIGMVWFYMQVFMGCVVLLYFGVFIVIFMSGNVFFIIMFSQWIVVVDLIVGCKLDVKFGKIVKQCSIYNNYLMLLVIFLMLLNYYLLVFVSDYNWIIVSFVFLMGVIIWYYFNILYVCKGDLYWIWFLMVLIFVVIVWLLILFKFVDQDDMVLMFVGYSFVMVFEFEQVVNVVIGNCFMCYGVDLLWDGILWVLKGVMLENLVQIVN